MPADVGASPTRFEDTDAEVMLRDVHHARGPGPGLVP